MFTIVAATVFFVSFMLAAGTIAAMLALYHDKMVAALLFEPIPQEPPIYRLRVSRRRAARHLDGAAYAMPTGVIAA